MPEAARDTRSRRRLGHAPPLEASWDTVGRYHRPPVSDVRTVSEPSGREKRAMAADREVVWAHDEPAAGSRNDAKSVAAAANDPQCAAYDVEPCAST